MITTAYFYTQTVTLSAGGTNVDRSTSESEILASNLNLSSTLTIAARENTISGTVITARGAPDNANHKFYGPTANEVGGTYAVSGSNLGSFVGGFGGKR